MSEEHGPDEIWTTRNGDKIKVGDLSEAHAKNILRMILKEERERKAAIDSVTEVLAMIRGINSELASSLSGDLASGRVVIFHSDDEDQTSMDDIDSMFRKHGAAED
jgi:hypothetical protein